LPRPAVIEAKKAEGGGVVVVGEDSDEEGTGFIGEWLVRLFDGAVF
jgi:hypothetical protein